ncbi:MAG: GDPmannose 4,6-dehydratase [Rhodoglobus sp.]|nr:GDPmannose 4,6-dehydratase [Rhodoglobus sp.]
MPIAFVTGVTGQDGSYLVDDLTGRGYEVHGLVKPGDSATRLAPSVIAHQGDLRDADLLGDLVLEIGPDEVYNLAGQTSVAASWDDPVATAQTTGTTVAAIAQACWVLHERGHPVRMLQASSAEMFGLAEEMPQRESTRIAPVSPYGAAKAYGHFMVASYRLRGLHASTCILYNHESPLRPETFVTRKITASVARIARGVQDVIRLGNLDVSRDWGWAPDYVRAMQLALGHESPGDYVIGTGALHTVREFVIAAFEAANVPDWESHVVIDPAFARQVDPPRQLADSTLAREVLGWEPTVTFDELVAAMVHHDLVQIDTSAD